MTDKERFDGKCPYTDKPCDDWDCANCEVNAEERKMLEEHDGMTVQDILDSVRNGKTDKPDDSTLLVIYLDRDGRGDVVGNASSATYKSLGLHFIERAIKEEIKQSL